MREWGLLAILPKLFCLALGSHSLFMFELTVVYM